jgi:DNA-binding beta-propeller fold protein YncE
MRIVNDIVYTTDRMDHVSRVFTLEGKLMQMIGVVGRASDTGVGKSPYIVQRAAGPFNQPTELMPSPSGELYATDGYGNCRVHRFTRDGQLIESWGEPGKTEPGHFHLVHGIVFDPDGTLYVCDRSNRRVQVFSAAGKYLRAWTGMGGPNDIARDQEGNFYICEQEVDGGPAHISIRDNAGGVLARWQTRHAHGLTVDSKGDIYVGLSVDHNVDKYVRSR